MSKIHHKMLLKPEYLEWSKCG